MEKAIDNLLDSIEEMLKSFKKKMKFDITVSGVVTEEIGSGKYKVKINDTEREVKSKPGDTYSEGDVVYVRLVQGSWNEKFIDCKKPPYN